MDKLFETREIVDPVWMMDEYKMQTFQLEEAIQFHMELADVQMLNNMDGIIGAKFELNMATKKKVLAECRIEQNRDYCAQFNYYLCLI